MSAAVDTASVSSGTGSSRPHSAVPLAIWERLDLVGNDWTWKNLPFTMPRG